MCKRLVDVVVVCDVDVDVVVAAVARGCCRRCQRRRRCRRRLLRLSSTNDAGLGWGHANNNTNPDGLPGEAWWATHAQLHVGRVVCEASQVKSMFDAMLRQAGSEPARLCASDLVPD